MKRLIGLAAALVVASPLALALASAQSVDEQIAEAVTPLPEDLKADATVVTYDEATGARKVLRQGTNFIECQPKTEDGFVRCYNKAFGPRRDLEAKLRAEGKSDEEIQQAIAAAVKAGTIPAPPKGSMSYRYYDKPDRIQMLWVMSMPNAQPDTIAASTGSQRDAALKGQGLPWMMRPGEPGAHIMIPINPPAEHSTISDEAADPVAQAVLPLPEDLRADATVYTYDDKGERKILKQGTNNVECMPRDSETMFTWCYSTASAARRDMSAKLRAEGKSNDEVRAAIEEATKAGRIQPTPFGTMTYRMYSKDDRIRLLWVISVPNATSESVGVSTVSQRDNALKGDGRPWLMLEGTPGAHIMIPINK